MTQCLTYNLHVLLCTSDNLKAAYSECNNTHSSNCPVMTKPASIHTSGGVNIGKQQPEAAEAMGSKPQCTCYISQLSTTELHP